MNLLGKKIALMFIFMIAATLNAQEINDGRYQNIIKQLKLKGCQIREDLVVEKKMPNVKNSYIVVVPVLVEEFQYDSFTVKNTILVTDQNGIIINKYLDPTDYNSDAIMLTGFSIDTGHYNLNSKIRAFGVTANYTGSSRPNPYSSTVISMYYLEGRTMRKVLNQLTKEENIGEWNMSCEGDFEENNSIIILDKAMTNGFADLKIKTEKVKQSNKEVDGECIEDKKSTVSYKTLKFNKSTYQ